MFRSKTIGASRFGYVYIINIIYYFSKRDKSGSISGNITNVVFTFWEAIKKRFAMTFPEITNILVTRNTIHTGSIVSIFSHCLFDILPKSFAIADGQFLMPIFYSKFLFHCVSPIEEHI